MSARPPDPMAAAVCALLRNELGGLLTQTPPGLKGVPANVPAVFRPDLPAGFDGEMPAACIVVRRAGGYTQYGRGQLRIGDPRMDIICYGATSLQATDIADQVVVAVKQVVSQVWENTRIYSVNVSGGPVPLPDQQTLWPACWLSVQVLAGELPVS